MCIIYICIMYINILIFLWGVGSRKLRKQKFYGIWMQSYIWTQRMFWGLM